MITLVRDQDGWIVVEGVSRCGLSGRRLRGRGERLNERRSGEEEYEWSQHCGVDCGLTFELSRPQRQAASSEGLSRARATVAVIDVEGELSREPVRDFVCEA